MALVRPSISPTNCPLVRPPLMGLMGDRTNGQLLARSAHAGSGRVGAKELPFKKKSVANTEMHGRRSKI